MMAPESSSASSGDWPSTPVVAMTGANSGIGLASARAFASRGAKLALGYYGRAEAIDRLAAEHPGGEEQVLNQEFDVADRAAAADFIQLAEEHFGRVDVLVTCAAIHIW